MIHTKLAHLSYFLLFQGYMLLVPFFKAKSLVEFMSFPATPDLLDDSGTNKSLTQVR